MPMHFEVPLPKEIPFFYSLCFIERVFLFGFLSNAKPSSFFFVSFPLSLHDPMEWITSPSNLVLSMSLLSNFLIVTVTGSPFITHYALTILLTDVIVLEYKIFTIPWQILIKKISLIVPIGTSVCLIFLYWYNIDFRWYRF